MVMALAIVTWPLSVSGEDRDVGTRIMAADPSVRELLREGSVRSETLRALINVIEESRWRVFIQRGPCPARALTSCLLHFTGIFEGEPYLRILITVAGRHRDQVIASLAHEIQHAVEVVQAPEVVDVATLRTMFRRIGVVRVSNSLVTVYETRAAEEAGYTVQRELHRTQRAVQQSP
jgi:hypothetical protein